MPHLPPMPRLVLLGRSVQKAFAGLLEETRITCLPHLSGRNQSLQEGAPIERRAIRSMRSMPTRPAKPACAPCFQADFHPERKDRLHVH